MWWLLLAACADDPDIPIVEFPIRIVSFNTGTTEGLPHDAEPGDGYSSEDALVSDTWYGDGLAWLPAVDAATDWFAEVRPDLVGFQEIFWSEACTDIPVDAHEGFVCETWSPEDPTVANLILGEDYQVACHPGKPDKCLAVRTDFGTFRGCEGDLCLEGLDGASVEGCGSGARVARGIIDRAEGSSLTVVHVHGSSGLSEEDQACRTAQVEQVFVDLDGEPAANGARNVILGDLNTDPGRWAEIDPSAARWNDFVTGDPFAWLTDIGPNAEPTYLLANIDHVVTDFGSGGCLHEGDEGVPAVIDAVYFDHAPVVCELAPDE